MTLQQLRYVTAVADCGSMNEAAKTLFVSQPGLSGAIKELEEETGIEIFKRTNKGVLPTALSAGQRSARNSAYPCSIIPLR